MDTISTVEAMETARRDMSGTVGLVPTMGYLHEGHLSLVRRAFVDNDQVVVSIFVNPTQFGPKEDLDRYPRDLSRDLELIGEISPSGSLPAVLVFNPTVDEMYPAGFDEWVEVRGPLTERLEGEQRPGHFRGVATVVTRLFRIIRPDRAYFGQKDAQQLRVIRRMVQEQGLGVEIVPMPTVREPDGVAMSSRNVYLSPEEREVALAVPRALALARRTVMEEGVTDAETVRKTVRTALDTSRRDAPTHLFPDYVSVSDEQTLEELEIIDRPALVLLAARVGATRLIDNTIVIPEGIPIPEDLRSLVQSDSALIVTLDT